jgi:hypothetical protein
MENRPPPAEVFTVGNADVGLIDPVLGYWSERLTVVRPHLEPVMEVIADTCTAGQRKNGPDRQRQHTSPEYACPEHLSAFLTAQASDPT